MKKGNAAFKRRKVKRYFEVLYQDGTRKIFYEKSVEGVKKHLKKYIEEWEEKIVDIKEFTNIVTFDEKFQYTVGNLKRDIQNLPDDMPILYEIIGDVYFKEYGWGVKPLYDSLQYPCYSEFVKPFCGFLDADKKYFCLSAHY